MKTLIESLTTTVKTYAEGEVITRNLSSDTAKEKYCLTAKNIIDK